MTLLSNFDGLIDNKVSLRGVCLSLSAALISPYCYLANVVFDEMSHREGG